MKDRKKIEEKEDRERKKIEKERKIDIQTV